jgi:thiol:disulfide interchange protein DsbD
MRFVGVAMLIAILPALASSAVGQGSAKVVKVSNGETVYRIKKASTARIEVILEIESGYHINSNRPLDKNLIATVLKLDKTAGLRVLPVRYPKAKMKKFQFSPKPLSVFEGKVKLLVPLRVLASAPAGHQDLKGKLTIQACNEEACLRPQTVDVTIPLEVL